MIGHARARTRLACYPLTPPCSPRAGAGASSVDMSEVAVSDVSSLLVTCTASELQSPPFTARSLSSASGMEGAGGASASRRRSGADQLGPMLLATPLSPNTSPRLDGAAAAAAGDGRRARTVSSSASEALGIPAFSAFRRMSGSGVSGHGLPAAWDAHASSGRLEVWCARVLFCSDNHPCVATRFRASAVLGWCQRSMGCVLRCRTPPPPGPVSPPLQCRTVVQCCCRPSQRQV